MSDIEIEIDGKTLQAKPNATVMQVADEAGIYIPRFCYHKHLSIAANCRMCLVEVEKSPKPLPACATPVMPGMKVFTRSAKAIAAQKAVMEFLLINHPLDCPICDQGGECELQDLSMGYGSAESFYSEGKRSVKDQNIGPLVATDMTRCIQCTRCVRFGAEVAGFRELGVVNRGERSEITTYVQHALESEVSGNIIDLCPVGALTSKPFRFTARAWELQQFPSIAAHDCAGSNIYVHTRNNKVMRVVPRENPEINRTWLSDRDRFSYEGLYHDDRVTTPLIRTEEGWRATDWETALEFTIEGLQQVLNTHGCEQLGALASPNSTLEEFYLLQKLLRSLGSSNIDHRLREVDFSDQKYIPIPMLNMPLENIEKCKTIILIGTHLQKEEPIISLKVREASLKGAKVIVINMLDYNFHYRVAKKKILAPHEFVAGLKNYLNDDEVKNLLTENTCVLLGAQALNHPQAAMIRSIASQWAEEHTSKLGILTDGANGTGGWIAGAVPHRGAQGASVKEGMNVQQMLEKPRKAYLLLNAEPDLDFANPVLTTNALSQAQFVVSLSLFKNPVLEQFAHVILPMAAFAETSGTFVNTEGKWQSFKGVAAPVEEARPAWKILRVFANFLKCEGFDYKSSEEIKHELLALQTDVDNLTRGNENYHAEVQRYLDTTIQENTQLSRVGEIPIYAGDSIVRHAKSLQATQLIMEPDLTSARIHPLTAERLKLKEKEEVVVTQSQGGHVRVPIILDKRVPENGVYIPGGISTTSDLTELFGMVEIQQT